MPQAIKVLIAKFKPPFLTIMGKLTYIIILWQAICNHLEKKEHSTCTLFTPGIVIVGGTTRSCQWPACSRHDKVKAVRPEGGREESVHSVCPVELTEDEKYWNKRKSTLHQITFYSSLNKNFLGCLQLLQLGLWFIDHKYMHRAIFLMMCWGFGGLQREEQVCAEGLIPGARDMLTYRKDFNNSQPGNGINVQWLL